MDNLVQELDKYFRDIKSKDIAVGVSGGADSVALWHVLKDWSRAEVHVLVVDHGLRAESRQEARDVAARTGGVVLTWEGKPESRVQERAREARYDLMAGYMAEHGLKHLFLAHHMDDQAETFLMRLAGGSGVDGLACMRARQERGEIVLCRPFLVVRKEVLARYCDSCDLGYVHDPSNESDNFSRVRVRKSMDVLAEEGLTVARLAKSAERFSRVRVALEKMACEAYKICALEKKSDRIVFCMERLCAQVDEITIRMMLKTIDELTGQAVRLQKVEDLCSALYEPEFRKRTLGGCVFAVDGVRLVVEREDAR